ncbi:E3 ubiquitin-protein ligase MYCBP2-like isoform X2 [Asterias rubens]|uniref:E3 ubiquitin-protein ligase MYCBP2-like isoform X2 n=1 Tax=Asterias rubens TaxID=7604 RepID=UPI001455C196|nr:E3 ubiquitin-protein ligase MYCBP2-like isoform X2 [Asterias rubens]
MGSFITVPPLKYSSIFLQGFCNGQKGTKQRLKRAEGVGKSILDMVIGAGGKLYYVLANGECIVTDIHSDNSSNVLVVGVDDAGESERPHFLRVSAGEMNTVALTDKSSGLISTEKQDYIFRPLDCSLKLSQVSCGKEHVMLLSNNHQVYTFGLGSRGQLGHGSTEKEGQPTLVEATAGVPMVAVSAGGWHSASVSTIGDLYIWGWNESGQLGFPTKNDKTSPDAQCTSQGESLEAADNLDSSRMKTTLEEGCSRRAHPQETDSKPESAKKMRFSDSVESADMSKEQLHECGGVVRSTTDTDDNNGMYKGQLENASTATQISLTTLDVLHEDVSKTSDEMRRQSTQSQDISQQKAFSTTLGRFNKDPVRDQSREQIANREVHLGSESKEDTAGDRWDGDEGGGSDVVLIQALPAILDLPDGKDVSKVSCGSRHTAAISVDGELYTWGWGAYGQLGHGDSETLDVPTLVNSLPEHQKVLEVFCGGWNTLITVAAHL